MKNHNRQSGFTLIELMVVVLIIGLLSSIAIPVFGRALEKANRAATGASLVGLHNAMARYYADNGEFPTLDTTTFEPLIAGGYMDDPELLLRKFRGNAVLAYLDLGDFGWWLVVSPKGDPNSKLYTGHIYIPFAIDPVDYDGVYWYNSTETPTGLARLDGNSI